MRFCIRSWIVWIGAAEEEDGAAALLLLLGAAELDELELLLELLDMRKILCVCVKVVLSFVLKLCGEL